MRKFLDRIYGGALWVSAACLVVIAAMIGVQLAARILDGTLALLHLPVTGFQVLSLAEISGYLLATASFMALAGTLKGGAHIRVTMVLSAVGEGARWYIELVAFSFAAVASAYMTWQLTKFAFVSWQFDEVSSGIVRVPLVYPQAAMAVGALILTICLIDELFVVWSRGRPSFRAAEDAISLGKEG